MGITGQEKREVVIYLPNCKVEGWVFLPKEAHLADFIALNPKKFVMVTDAYISAIRAHEAWKYRVDTININKEYILNIFSRGAMKPTEGGEKDVKEP
jgi:hypothetical protein